MKSSVRVGLSVILWAVVGVTAASGEERAAGPKEQVSLLYEVLFNREDFYPPKTLDDATVDEAMRLGLFPRDDEPAGMPGQYFLLAGALEEEISKLAERVDSQGDHSASGEGGAKERVDLVVGGAREGRAAGGQDG